MEHMLLPLKRGQAQIAFILDREDAMQGMVCKGTDPLTVRLLLSGRQQLFSCEWHGHRSYCHLLVLYFFAPILPPLL